MRNTLIFCALAALAGCGKPGGEAPAAAAGNEVRLSAPQARQMTCEVAPVREEGLAGAVQAVGRLTFDDQRVTHVFSPVSGRVTRLVADLGQRVKPGQVLALIDSPDMGSALSDFHKAQASLTAAEKDYRRQKDLFEGHAGAERDYEAAEATWRNALAERDRARQRAELFYGKGMTEVSQGFQLRSPIQGEVIAMGANPGLEVQGQYGGGTAVELFTVGEVDSLRLLADVQEMDIPKVRLGGRLHYEVGGVSGEGVINWVSGSLDPATRTVQIRCNVPNPQRLLKPEMFARVVLEVPGRKGLAVPRSALLRIGDLVYVFVDLGPLPDGGRRFERRQVQADEHQAGDLVPILGGLKPGEPVVVKGALQLSGVNG